MRLKQWRTQQDSSHANQLLSLGKTKPLYSQNYSLTRTTFRTRLGKLTAPKRYEIGYSAKLKFPRCGLPPEGGPAMS